MKRQQEEVQNRLNQQQSLLEQAKEEGATVEPIESQPSENSEIQTPANASKNERIEELERQLEQKQRQIEIKDKQLALAAPQPPQYSDGLNFYIQGDFDSETATRRMNKVSQMIEGEPGTFTVKLFVQEHERKEVEAAPNNEDILNKLREVLGGQTQ
jgi:hypothetical protein